MNIVIVWKTGVLVALAEVVMVVVIKSKVRA